MCDSTALQKRISRVLEIGADSSAMLESLAVVSSFLGKMDNCNRASSDHHNNQKKPLRDGEDTGVRLSQAARKGLGDNLEKENRYLVENFVGCFGKVIQRLNNMEEGLERMERGAESIIERLEEADESVKSFSQRTKALRRQRSELKTRAEEVESLLNKFQLSSEENDILNKGPGESSDNFFVVLARLKVARDECHKLVGSLHQSAGFELLDALSHQQEIAYERLYHWVLENCDAIEDSAGSSTTLSQATFNPALHRALNALSDRPAFFRHCQERIVGVRRVVVRKSFFAEFSQGFYSGDVVQYLGDVLAWVHQTSAAQHEFAVGLVGEQASKQLVLHIMAGIAKPLLTRLEPLLVGQKKTIVLARAPDLLGFYNAKLLQFTGSSTEENDSCDDINEEKSLSDVLSSLRATARSEFLTILRTVASQIESSYPTYFVDHSPLQITTTSLRLLVEVLDARDSSLFQEGQAGDKDAPDSTANVIGFFVDPLLSVCRKSGQGLASGDTSVFMLNNIHVMQSALAEKAGASSWVEELTRQAEGYLDEIVTYESKRFLVACGMGLMLEAFHTATNSSDDVTSVCGHLGASQAEVENVMGRFYSALFSMALPDFERIQEPWAREQVIITEILVVVLYDRWRCL